MDPANLGNKLGFSNQRTIKKRLLILVVRFMNSLSNYIVCIITNCFPAQPNIRRKWNVKLAKGCFADSHKFGSTVLYCFSPKLRHFYVRQYYFATSYNSGLEIIVTNRNSISKIYVRLVSLRLKYFYAGWFSCGRIPLFEKCNSHLILWPQRDLSDDYHDEDHSLWFRYDIFIWPKSNHCPTLSLTH